jgi:hypothetical protein
MTLDLATLAERRHADASEAIADEYICVKLPIDPGGKNGLVSCLAKKGGRCEDKLAELEENVA